jgi:hypothetical protein
VKSFSTGMGFQVYKDTDGVVLVLLMGASAVIRSWYETERLTSARM